MRTYTKPVSPDAGQVIRASHMKSYSRAIEELQSKLYDGSNKNKDRYNKKPPFWVTIYDKPSNPSDLVDVSVALGKVCEVEPGAEDAILYHEPDNYLTGGEPTRFGLNETKSIYVKVEVGVDGKITPPEGGGSAVTLTVETTESTESIHYQPKCDDESSDGVVGTYYYRLASISVNESGVVTLDKFLTGSHIFYTQDLPKMFSTNSASTGIGVIPKKWDNEQKGYVFRSLSIGGGQLSITTNADDIEVTGNDKNAKITYTIGDESPVDLVEFTDGLIINGSEGSAPTEFNIPIPNPSIPDGLNTGDMLYWNGTEWVLLPAPDEPATSDGINVLIHDGFTPDWNSSELKTLQYVGDNNTAETAQFYIKPIPPV